MKQKNDVAKLLESTRKGRVIKQAALVKQVRLMLQSVVGRIRQIQVEADEDGRTFAIPGPMVSEFAKIWRAVEQYDAAHQDPEEKEKLKKGTYGGIYEDDEGEPVESSWDDTETPQA